MNINEMENKIAELELRIEHIESMLNIKQHANQILNNVKKPLNSLFTLNRKVMKATNAFVKEIKK